MPSHGYVSFYMYLVVRRYTKPMSVAKRLKIYNIPSYLAR